MYNSNTGKILFHFLRERVNLFNQNLSQLSKKLDENEIHNLRRSGKRIKALYLLFSEIDKEAFDFKKRFMAIKNLSAYAGGVREIQVNLRTLKAYNPSVMFTKHYLDIINERRAELQDKLSEAIRRFEYDRHLKSEGKGKKLCKKVEHSAIINATENSIQKNLKKIKSLLGDTITEENVHSIRISLKKISPIISLLNKLEEHAYTDELLTSIKNVEDKIGYWHDRVILHDSLLAHRNSFERLDDAIYAEYTWIDRQLSAENDVFIKSFPLLIKPYIEQLHVAGSMASNNP